MSCKKISGDWICPNCNFLIWASKGSCKKCGATKPRAGGAGRNKSKLSKSDDWLCTHCRTSNFSDRDKCRKCHKDKEKKKDDDISSTKSVKLPKIDWICFFCKNSNFVKRKKCRKCNKQKELGEQQRKLTEQKAEKLRKMNEERIKKEKELKEQKQKEEEEEAERIRIKTNHLINKKFEEQQNEKEKEISHKLEQEEQPNTSKPTPQYNLLTKHRLDALVTGYLTDDRFEALKKIIMKYCLCIKFNDKYFQILINKSPNESPEFGDKSEYELPQILFKPDSRYFIDKNKCSNCYCSNNDLLEFHCSYRNENKWPYNVRYSNLANEYQCKQCKFYIAFSFKNTSTFIDGVRAQVSPYGNREKQNDASIAIESDSKKCPECNYVMEILARYSTSKYSPACHGDSEYFSAETYHTETKIYLCRNCDLVATLKRSWETEGRH